MKQNNQKKMDRKGRMIRIRRTIRRLLLAAGIVIALVICADIFLVVKTVRVINDTRYLSADVLADSGIDIGTPILSVRSGTVRKKLISDYPYIKTAETKISFPFSVTLRLTESRPFLALQKEDGSYYYLDDNMKVLESSFEYYEDTVLVTGMSFEQYSSSAGIVETEGEIVPGTVMTPEVNIEMEIVDDLIEMLFSYQLTDRLTSIDLSTDYNLKLILDGSITVELGTSENLDRKFAMMKTILERNIGVSSMIINVRDYTKGRCRILDE